ncbi:hypothetical protein HPB51_008755 [Rhipicephalus microplus]|uniref:Uncharacterized protein n=1 Tax=Rhipicephalus microplus TaxID=6941 RepID=A0A9J6EGX7_RHIMP|nr:hypothetical protein HPB51_008755 [Rhipicephalus microplus]
MVAPAPFRTRKTHSVQIRLSSVLFDKVMMIVGDPSDMRQFISRQEDVAFSDLVWVAVLHAFPQAVLQLYLLLFPGGADLLRGDWPDYTGGSHEVLSLYYAVNDRGRHTFVKTVFRIVQQVPS